jgi:predicted house-cleaning noncanonical NTP pyrophosphatase (MazG superfamily)
MLARLSPKDQELIENLYQKIFAHRIQEQLSWEDQLEQQLLADCQDWIVDLTKEEIVGVLRKVIDKITPSV